MKVNRMNGQIRFPAVYAGSVAGILPSKEFCYATRREADTRGRDARDTITLLCRCIGWVVLCGGGFITPAKVRAETYGKVSVQLEPIPQSQGYTGSEFGYLEYRFDITNRSPEKDHIVELVLPKEAFYRYGVHLSRIRKAVRVPASSTVQVSLYQPPVPLGGNEVGVTINGEEMKRGISVSHVRHGGEMGFSYRYPAAGPGSDDKVLVSRSVGTKFRDWMDGISTEICCRSETPATRWSTNWLGYSRFSGVVITAGDWYAMPTPTKRALREYVECGGSLVLLGAATLPKELTRADTPEGAAECYLGFGSCRSTEDLAAVPLRKTIRKMWRSTARPWSHPYSIESANRAFPVVEELDIPVRGMLVLMVIFAVVAGPVSIWLLGKWKKRMWLLWVIPAISLLTCGGVFLYSALAEGWQAEARTSVLTILDENTNRAATIGWTAFYSPLTPSGGLPYSTETELTPALREDFGSRRSLTMDWTNTQRLDSGWVVARVPAHFRVRKNEIRRERLSVRRNGAGDLVVMNGLGADIETLRLADPNGVIWAGSNIPAGKEVSLARTAGNLRAKNNALRSVYANKWLRQCKTITSRPEQYLLPNTYIAVLPACPFLDPGLENLKTWNAQTIVYGIQKREP